MSSYSQLLITGGSGFLGWNIARYATNDHDVYVTYHKHPIAINKCEDTYRLDLKNPETIEKVVEEVQPEVIIHTAAMADADLCEQRRSIAHEVNVKGTRYLAQCAEDIGARLIYISTDMVFDGKKGNYGEKDRPKPINYYGETKLLGEKAVKETVSNYLIVRMALMYGHGNEKNGCFTDWIRHSLQRQKQVALFIDQYRTPLFVQDGVRALFELIDQPVSNEVFHLAGQERLTRYEFGKKFCTIFGYEEQYLHQVKMQEIDMAAKRGCDCSLSNRKAQKFLSFQLSDVTGGLQKMKLA